MTGNRCTDNTRLGVRRGGLARDLNLLQRIGAAYRAPGRAQAVPGRSEPAPGGLRSGSAVRGTSREVFPHSDQARSYMMMSKIFIGGFQVGQFLGSDGRAQRFEVDFGFFDHLAST